jgi:protease-4
VGGSFPARRRKRKLLSLPPDLGPQDTALEVFAGQVSALARAPWLEGVVLRIEGLETGLSGAFALRQQIAKLRAAGKQVVALLTRLDDTAYYLASAADEICVPESAEFAVHGVALELLFMRDALARFGASIDKLAIAEYKNAADSLVRQEMSEPQRRQYSELLDSFSATFREEVAAARGVTPETVGGWIDAGVTSAGQALQLGMIDRVLYEDELLSGKHRTWREAGRFVPVARRTSAAGRVAVITLSGTIVTGRSARSPLPLPLIGGERAGSETLLQAFRAAEADRSTAAIVFFVDSGGGSALASDLIWREVARIRKSKPVVAVMGSLAASGGYYVLTHADHVIAAPVTLTGSIGVVAAKPVLEDFHARYGFNSEVIRRGRYSLLSSSRKPFDDGERALVQRLNSEVYERFTARVAAGRGLSREQVEELARGRIWSGTAALGKGLVDELGDVELGLRRARELAGLPADARSWNVPAAGRLLLPTAEDPTTLQRSLAPLLRERVLLLHDAFLRLG